MINQCDQDDFEAIFAIINDGAKAYRGIIPDDRWHDPYMSRDELRHEIERGVRFWGYRDGQAEAPQGGLAEGPRARRGDGGDRITQSETERLFC